MRFLKGAAAAIVLSLAAAPTIAQCPGGQCGPLWLQGPTPGQGTNLQWSNSPPPGLITPVQTPRTGNYTLLYTGSTSVTGSDSFTTMPFACTTSCTVTLPTSTATVFPPSSTFAIHNESTASSVNILIAATGPSTLYGSPTVIGTGNISLIVGETAYITVDASNNYYVQVYGAIPGMDTATGTTYTANIYDCYQMRHLNNASATTVTIPTGLPPGCNLNMTQDGGGQVGFAAGSGMTLHYQGGTAQKSVGQYAVFGVAIGAGGTVGTVYGNVQ